MPTFRFFILSMVLFFFAGRLAAQYTTFDIIYCLNGGENKSGGIMNLPVPNPPAKPGWNLIFSDEFQPDSINGRYWNRSTPWDDGDGTCHRNFAVNPANVTAAAGCARISNTADPSLPGCPFSGGEIKTMSVGDTSFGSFYFYAPGYVETRVRLFNKTGQGAACWLWAVGEAGEPGAAGPWHEIDLFEINGVNRNIVTGTYHWTSGNTHVSQNYSIYLTDSAQLYDLTSNWTTFGLEWDTASIRWYINNSLVKELDLGLVPPYCVGSPRYKKPLAPFCIRLTTLSNTVGNQNTVANPADFPQTMLVDYVRAYKKSGVRACPILMRDSMNQICATAVSAATSGKIIRARYYPGVSYEWSSPAFVMEKSPSPIPQPPEKMHIWIKPGVEAGKEYPVYLKTTFPSGYTEYDTAHIFIVQESPELPPDAFSPEQIDSLCYYSINTPAQPNTAGCEFSLDSCVTWIKGSLLHNGGSGMLSFGMFRAERPVEFAFREQNGCGWSPVRYASLTMPPAPAGCIWPEGVHDPGYVSSVSHFRVSPNPAGNTLTISASPGEHSHGTADIRIFDLNGRVVMQRTMTGEECRIDISSLQRGMYCLVTGLNDRAFFRTLFLKK